MALSPTFHASTGDDPPGPVDPLAFRGPGELLPDPLAILTQLRQKYGDVVRYRFKRTAAARGTVTVVSDPVLVQEVYKSHRFLRAFDRSSFFGKSMLGLGGPAWERRRRSLLPLFSRSRVESLVEVFRQEAVAMVDSWPTGGGAVDGFVRQLDMLTLAIAGRCLFGTRITLPVADAIQTQLRQMALCERVLFGLPMTLQAAAMRAFTEASSVIARFAQQVCESDAPEWLAMRAGVVASLVDDMSVEHVSRHLRDEVVAMMLAASETTSTTLGWVWMLLLLHPRWHDAVCDEVDEVLGGRPVTAAELPRLRVIQMVIHETLRLYPAIWQTPRTVVCETRLGGFLIPAQSLVMISPYVVQRHEGYWADPDSFEPERFRDPAMVDHPAYVPFLTGRHSCVGKQFSLLLISTIIATVVQRARITLTDSSFRPVIESLATIRMREPMPVRCDPRSVGGGR